jgi:hypothetical protein
VGKLTSTSKTGPVWTDDGQQLCDMWDVPTPTLVSMTPSSSRSVTRFPALASDQTSMHIAACSTRSDLAVVVNNGPMGWTVQYWVVQLSTGQIVRHRTFASDSQIRVVASPDARVIAEGAAIFDAAGRQIARPAGPVAAFSADGSLAAIDAWDGSRVIAVAGGSSIWYGGKGERITTAYANPDDPKQMAVAINPTGDAAGPDGYPAASGLHLVTQGDSGVSVIIIRS